MLIASIQAIVFASLFITYVMKELKSYHPHFLLLAILVNTVSVVTTPESVTAVVDGFGACVLGFILYKHHTSK